MAKVYFEDVQVGQELPSYKVKAGYMELNRFAGANDELIPIHMDPDFAKNVAKLPDVIIMGNLKLAYMCNVLTNWGGDDLWVKKLEVSYRKMDVVNETITAKAVVKAKRTEGGEHLVDLELWAENGKGEKTTPGSAVVSLPARS
jgi:acyl dehydratase